MPNFIDTGHCLLFTQRKQFVRAQSVTSMFVVVELPLEPKKLAKCQPKCPHYVIPQWSAFHIYADRERYDLVADIFLSLFLILLLALPPPPKSDN